MVQYGGPRPVKSLIQNVTVTRALNTIYQNLTGRPLIIQATLTIVREAGDTNYALAFGEVAVSTPPGVTFAACGLNMFAGASKESAGLFMSFAVPPGYYYRIRWSATGGTVTLSQWCEVEL